MDTPPTTEDWAQHPALNIAMDGISIYANWVSRVVMPIAFLWIDEHKKEICENAHWDKLPDDVNKVINAAFSLAKEQHYYKEGRIEFYELQHDLQVDPARASAGLNESWVGMSKALRSSLDEQFHLSNGAKRPGGIDAQAERIKAERSSDMARVESLTPA